MYEVSTKGSYHIRGNVMLDDAWYYYITFNYLYCVLDIVGLKKEGENFQWKQVNSLSTGRYHLASVNAPISMVPSC